MVSYAGPGGHLEIDVPYRPPGVSRAQRACRARKRQSSNTVAYVPNWLNPIRR